MESGTSSFTLLELFSMGGVIMWPLLFYSVATITIALERTIYLFYHDLGLADLKEHIYGYLTTGNIQGAQDYLSGQTKRRIGARILLTLVNRSNLSEHQMEKAVEADAVNRINSLENGFNLLLTLGSLSPLTGFLGTVTGMIGAFKAIAEAPDVNAQIVAGGIYEALITTVFGLIIAIIAMIAHSLLSQKVDKFAVEVEKTCSDLITELTLRSASQPAKGDIFRISLPAPSQADIIPLEDYT